MLDLFNAWKNYIIMGLLIILLGFGLWHWVQSAVLKAQITSLKATVSVRDARITTLEADIAIAEKANKQLLESVTKQNGIIDGWVKGAEERKKIIATTVATAKADVLRWKTMYASVLSQPPPNPPDACGSLEQRFNDYLSLREAQP